MAGTSGTLYLRVLPASLSAERATALAAWRGSPIASSKLAYVTLSTLTSTGPTGRRLPLDATVRSSKAGPKHSSLSIPIINIINCNNNDQDLSRKLYPHPPLLPSPETFSALLSAYLPLQLHKRWITVRKLGAVYDLPLECYTPPIPIKLTFLFFKQPRDDVYGAYDATFMSDNGPKQNTQQPIVTGTSVIAIKYKDGVVMAADNLASYGSLARFTDVKRLRSFAGTSVVGFSGDISDMQYLDRHLIDLSLDEAYTSPDTPRLNAANLHTYLAKLLYRRRSKFDPLWNHLLVAGLDDDDKPFLAAADLLGSTYSAPSLATGFGAMLAQPIMRRHVPDEEASQKLDKEEAVKIIKECMKVLYYRDARSLDSYSMAIVTKEGVEINEGLQLEAQSWAFAERIRGYGTQTV
ncbi:hypothetical protein KAF25_001758 [Fusarium avenaceum]|uniref:Proteasome subunit beta n=1 Tax=Fusarium avenaceum TaxID=40199 RepID=A0A9P7GW16_9HYPO|nr:hypothetical protein KAF25_001758 [Fusarium avenaceum]